MNARAMLLQPTTAIKTMSYPPTTANPENDNVDHINIYTKGKTELGRLLSHFTEAQFTHPVFGPFRTMEGYWHWVKSVERPDELRYMQGKQAKALGRTLTTKFIDNFQELITEGNFCKIEQHPRIKELLLESFLPFDHYYIFDPKVAGAPQLPVRPRHCDWLAKSFDDIRTMMQHGQCPPGLVF